MNMLPFGPFRLDPIHQRLERDGAPQALTPKAYALLHYLVQNPLRVVTKQELLETLWPNTIVGEGVLKVYVSEIRKALGDDSGKPRFVQTLHRRGYRFMAAGAATPVAPSTATGRRTELARLRRRFEAAVSGTQGVVFINAPAGMGKTTLLDAFVGEARSQAQVRVLRGQCVQHSGECEAFFPIIAALTHLAVSDAAVVPQLHQLAPTWLVQMRPLLQPEERKALIRELATIGQARMMRELLQFLAALCAQQPVLMTLEDVHWSDPSTIDVLGAVARHPGLGPLLVVATLRPADDPQKEQPVHALLRDLTTQRNAEVFAPQPLSEAEIKTYLGQRLPGLPAEEAAAMLQRRTGGNPMFVERVIDDWADQGWVGFQHGQWHFARDSAALAATVPNSLQLMLQAQFEHLSEHQQRMLGACCVAGDSFTADLVAAICGLKADLVHSTCTAMALNHQYLQNSLQRNGYFEFAHDLYREHLLGQLPLSAQRQWHRAAAQYKRSQPAEVINAADLAHHWQAAGDTVEAVEAWLDAARDASRRFAHREALLLLDRAAALLPSVAQAHRSELDASITRKRASILQVSGNSPACAAQWDHAAALAEEQGLTAERIDALLEAAAAYAFIDQESSLQRADLAVNLSRHMPGSLLAARAEGYRAYWQLYLRPWQPKRWALFQKCRDQIYQAGSLQHRCLFGILDASLVGVQGQYAEAFKLARQARQWAIEGEEHYEVFGSELYAIWLLMSMGEPGEALRLCRRTAALAEKNGLHICINICRLTEADIASTFGDPRLALQVCEPMWPFVAATANNASAGIVLSCAKTIARAHALQGNHEAAMAMLAAADDIANAKNLQPGPLFEMIYLAGCAECHLQARRSSEVEKVARRLLDLAAVTPEMSYVAAAHRMLAVAACQQGQEAQAREHSAQARAALEGRPPSFVDWSVRVTAALVEGGPVLHQQAEAALDHLAAALFEEPDLIQSMEGFADIKAFRHQSRAAAL